MSTNFFARPEQQREKRGEGHEVPGRHELLSRPGLSERDYFNAGVGLYQIENYEIAAQAFLTWSFTFETTVETASRSDGSIVSSSKLRSISTGLPFSVS